MPTVLDFGNLPKTGEKGRDRKPKQAPLRRDYRGNPGVRWNKRTQENTPD